MRVLGYALFALLAVLGLSGVLSEQTCGECPIGSFVNGNECQACGPGTYSIRENRPRCKRFPGCPVRSSGRAPDGTCVNPRNPLQGSVAQMQSRLTALEYADGKGVMKEKPSPRVISNKICKQTAPSGNPKRWNLLLIYFGQFLDHDVSLIGENSCGEQARIEVPKKDVVKGPMHFVRSEYVQEQLGTNRDYVNLNTAWLDLGSVYGDTARRNRLLRVPSSGERGKLKTNTFFRREFPPVQKQIKDRPRVRCGKRCKESASSFFCGDVRCNENPILTALTTIFIREHNRLADFYAADHPTATDEEVFQAARKYNIAEYQHVVWNEFLPAIVGKANLRRFAGSYGGFKSFVNPSVSIEFSTAAYRFGHSGIGEEQPIANTRGKKTGSLKLKDAFNNARFLISSRRNLGFLLNGARVTQSEVIDTQVVDPLRNQLFGNLDLASLNMQRGRDHGLGNINQLRKKFGLRPHTSLMSLSGGNQAMVDSLMEAYELDADNQKAVEYIDLWVAGLCEAPYRNSQMGETFTRVIIDQFKRMRDADPHWFEGLKHTLPGYVNVDGGLKMIILNNEDFAMNSSRAIFKAPRKPTISPVPLPTQAPTIPPVPLPTQAPTKSPVHLPTKQPTKLTGSQPTEAPTKKNKKNKKNKKKRKKKKKKY